MDASLLAGTRKTLLESGFAIVRSLLRQHEVEEAANLLDSLVEPTAWTSAEGKVWARETRPGHPGLERDFDQLEILYPSASLPHLLQTAAFARCQAVAQAISSRCGLSFDSLIVKAPHNQAETPWHRDADYSLLPNWSALQRSRLHLWVPLQPASTLNGGLEFIRGSHREGRSDDRPELFGHPNRVAVELDAGDVSVHTSLTLHYAGRNQTGRSRKAWILTFSPLGRTKMAVKRLLRQVPQPAFS